MTYSRSPRTATAVGFASPSEVDRMVRAPSWSTATTRFSWLIAATTVPPWNAKSSTGPRPVTATRPGPPVSGNRTSVPRSRLDTQTAPSWTLIPLAPKPLTGASSSPVAKAVTRPRETRQTVGAERVGDEQVAGRRVARDAVLEPGRRQRGHLDRCAAWPDPVEAGRRGAGRDGDVQVATGCADDAAEEQPLVDDRDVAVVRHRDAGDDPHLAIGRDPADLAGVGEGEVRGAVGLQGDVLRLLPGGGVERDDPRRRLRGHAE